MELFALFKGVYEHLKPDFVELARIRERAGHAGQGGNS